MTLRALSGTDGIHLPAMSAALTQPAPARPFLAVSRRWFNHTGTDCRTQTQLLLCSSSPSDSPGPAPGSRRTVTAPSPPPGPLLRLSTDTGPGGPGPLRADGKGRPGGRGGAVVPVGATRGPTSGATEAAPARDGPRGSSPAPTLRGCGRSSQTPLRPGRTARRLGPKAADRTGPDRARPLLPRGPRAAPRPEPPPPPPHLSLPHDAAGAAPPDAAERSFQLGHPGAVNIELPPAGARPRARPRHPGAGRRRTGPPRLRSRGPARPAHARPRGGATARKRPFIANCACAPTIAAPPTTAPPAPGSPARPSVPPRGRG